MSVAIPQPRLRSIRWTPARIAGIVLAAMVVICVGSLPYTLNHYADQNLQANLQAPGADYWLGTDALGRSVLTRLLLGGAISLGIGLAAATISVTIGTTWGLLAGYIGGRVDAAMMRVVDVLYGLPYILLVILLKVAFEPTLAGWLGDDRTASVVTLLVAIGAVSWLTLARVVRGQVLSLRSQPFVEAARAAGVPTRRILFRHMLPNLVGPIVVYAALTVPQAILQESFLSFLGIGVRDPLPSWGTLASAGLSELNPVASHWWLLLWPCLLLGVTLMALNFLGDGLRDRFDPHADQQV